MGQQRAASGTWRSHNKPTSRDSYETMGQQTCPSNMSHPAIEPDRVKKSKSRFEAERKIPSESEGKSSDFARYGMVVEKDEEATCGNSRSAAGWKPGVDIFRALGQPRCWAKTCFPAAPARFHHHQFDLRLVRFPERESLRGWDDVGDGH